MESSFVKYSEVRSMLKVPGWRQLNALSDAVTLLMIIGVIAVAAWLLSHSG